MSKETESDAAFAAVKRRKAVARIRVKLGAFKHPEGVFLSGRYSIADLLSDLKDIDDAPQSD